MWEYWISFVYSLNRNYKVLIDLKADLGIQSLEGMGIVIRERIWSELGGLRGE